MEDPGTQTSLLASQDVTRDMRRARREAIAIALAAMVAVGAGVLGLWLFSHSSIRENYRHYLVSMAQAAALQVDPVLHGQIRDASQRNGPEYNRAVDPLRRMRKASADIRYIYTAVLDGDDVRFVLDAAEAGDHDGDGLDDQAQVWEVYDDRDPLMLQVLGHDGVPAAAEATAEPYSDKWGSFMTGWAPILASNGRQVGVIGVDVDASVYIARVAAARDWALLGLLPAGLLILVLSMAFYRMRLRGLAADRFLAIEQARLKDSEGSFRSLFELSPVGISLNDLHSGRYLQVNDALVASSGYSREELLNLTYWDLTPKSFDTQEQAQLQSIATTHRYGPYEKEYYRKDGSRYPVLLSGMTMTDADGREVIWSIVQDISLRKAMEHELADAACRDKLTGLANRTLFMERLQRTVERVRSGEQARFAVLFLDFDRFKLVNDALGHDAGDELLRQIASRLRGSLRCADGARDDGRGNLIARFGGDEFLVLINDLQGSVDAERIADRLLNTLAPAYSIHARDVHSTASIGIVTSGQALESAEAIVRNADVAMYEAKRAGRACYVVFNESMHVRLTRHVTIESGLRKALGTAQLSLVYQPIVELDSGKMASVEALLRWNHPVLGNISPSEFIPVAEESGLIVALGQWVLHDACRMLADWRARDPATAPQTVSVNISRAELALGRRLLARVRETLVATGLPPHCLQLEVTEREVMRDPRGTHELMHELRDLGVRLAMDDFGTGTSSLGCLRDYPFDIIKIDRSFVHDLAGSSDVLAVIHATLTLVENLGKASVAEGVEDAAQVAILQSLGCRYAQGYYFSHPVPAEQLMVRLSPALPLASLPAA
jgi:diguanylate cyclase (GGDEF)-like protein/PAS domain S-box-containing protein